MWSHCWNFCHVMLQNSMRSKIRRSRRVRPYDEFIVELFIKIIVATLVKKALLGLWYSTNVEDFYIDLKDDKGKTKVQTRCKYKLNFPGSHHCSEKQASYLWLIFSANNIESHWILRSDTTFKFFPRFFYRLLIIRCVFSDVYMPIYTY